MKVNPNGFAARLKFCANSSQRVNKNKTRIFFLANVKAQSKEDFSDKLGFKVNEDLGKYLRILLLHLKVTMNMY
uniref:Uncharacterized protein n=1 Tax=Manihot esculenta TaxID=3983 RepID=A0A2C9UUL7_MANES